MDTSGGSEPKLILDKALADQMQKLSNRKVVKPPAKEKVLLFIYLNQ